MDDEYRLTPKRASSSPAGARPDVRAPYESDSWKDTPPLAGFEHAGWMCETPPLETEFRVVHCGPVMTVAFRCSDPEVKAPPPPAGRSVGRKHGRTLDHLVFYIDPTHDHAHYVRVRVDLSGHVELFRGRAVRMEHPSNDPPDETFDERQGTALSSHVTVEDGRGWEGAIEIPSAALGLEGPFDGRVMGFNCRRIRCKRPGEDYVWQQPRPPGQLTPFDYGDLYFTASPWRVAALDFGYFVWDRGVLRIELDAGGEAQGRALEAETRCVMPLEARVPFRFAAERAAEGGGASIEVPYDLDTRGKWLVAHAYTQRLEIDVREKETGRVVYAGSFPVVFCAGLIPNEPYGLYPDAPDPSPSDPDFMREKRGHVTGRLPRLFRRTTAEGAESDFVLESEDGRVRFNLMKAGVMDEIARYIESLFGDETNRLAAAMYFVHQRAVTRHARALGRIYPASPLSLIRAGGGICGVRAPVLTGLVSRMKNPRTGGNYHTRVLELGGHTVAAIADSRDEPDEACIVLDADVGLMFFAEGSSRLATLDELRKHPAIVARSTAHDFRHGHHMFSDPAFQFTHGWRATGAWPEGAPEW